MKTYAEKLKDPRWQRKRLEILQRDDFTCQDCGSTEKTLNVHHKLYSKGKSPWEYCHADLITLCDHCHQAAERNRDFVLRIFGDANRGDVLFRVCQVIEDQHQMYPSTHGFLLAFAIAFLPAEKCEEYSDHQKMALAKTLEDWMPEISRRVQNLKMHAELNLQPKGGSHGR